MVAKIDRLIDDSTGGGRGCFVDGNIYVQLKAGFTHKANFELDNVKA